MRDALHDATSSLDDLRYTLEDSVSDLSVSLEKLRASQGNATGRNGQPNGGQKKKSGKGRGLIGSMLGGPLLGPLLDAIRSLRAAFADSSGKSKGGNAAANASNLAGLFGKGGGGATEGAAAAEGGMSAMGAAGAAIGGVVAAIGAVKSALQEMIGAVFKVIAVLTPFIQAISPATVMQLNQAMRDLKATIGYAFIPVFQTLAGVFREVAGIILPLMLQLRPVIDQLSKAIGGEMVSVVRMVVSALSSLVPLLQFAVDVYSAMASVMNTVRDVLTVLIRTIADVVASLLGGLSRNDIKVVLKDMVDSFRQVIRQLILFGAAILKFFGLTDTLGSLIKNFKQLDEEQKNPKSGLKAAPTNVSMKGASDIARDLAMSSAAALGAGSTKTKSPDQHYEDMVKELQNTKDNGLTLNDLMTQLIGRVDLVLDKIGKDVKEAIPVPIREAASIGNDVMRGNFSDAAGKAWNSGMNFLESIF